MDIRQVLQYTFGATDTNQQKAAESELYNRFEYNPGQFLLSLAMLINDENTNEIIRQQAGTVVSRYIFFTRQDGVMFWDVIDRQHIQQMKQEVLLALASPSGPAKRAACNALAKMAVLEFPHNRWPQLVPTLLNAAKDHDLTFKKTAIVAMGFLCIDLKQNNVMLTQNDSESIFGAVYLGIVENELDIKREAIAAFTTIVAFMENNFEMQNIRIGMMKVVVNCFDQRELVQPTLHFFMQYTKCYFQYANQIAYPVFQKTKEVIKLCEQNSITTMELWGGIAEKEIELKSDKKPIKPNVLKPFLSDLVSLLLQVMTFVQRDDENNYREAAYRTLISICEAYPDQTIHTVINYAAQCTKSTYWKERQCACMVFSIVSALNYQAVKKSAEFAMQELFTMARDNDPFVVESNLIGLSKIMESYGGLLLKKNNYQDYISVLMDLIPDNSREHPTIQFRALECLSKMTEAMEDPDYRCRLSNDIVGIAMKMATLLTRQPTFDMSSLQAISITIIHLIQGNTDDKIGLHFMDFILEQAYKNQFSCEDEVNLKYTYLVILHTCILGSNAFVSDTLLEKILIVIQDHFAKIVTVDVDGLFIIGALSFRIGDRMTTIYNRIGKFINHAFTIKNDPAITKILPGVLGDIVRAVGKTIPEEITCFFQYFLDEFEHNLDREMKIYIIGGLGDLIRQSYNHPFVLQNTEKIWILINFSSKACLTLLENGEDLDYIDDLRDVIREFYECISSCVLREKKEFLLYVFENGMPFFVKTMCKRSNPSLDYFKKSFYLIFDIASLLISQDKAGTHDLLKRFLGSNEFIDLFNEMRHFEFDEEISKLQSYARGVMGSLGVEGIIYV